MAQKQVNIRIPDEDATVLAAAAFLQDQSLSDLARAVLLREVRVLAADPRVQQAVRLRTEVAAKEEGVLTDLPRRLEGGSGGGEPA